MAVASWILPVLWRAHEWEPALEQLVREVAAAETTSRARAAVLELGEPFEYLVSDRKKAIAVYELAGEPYSARRLAVELGWWAARARLTTALRALDTSDVLAIEEAEAWWDAGQPDLCALAASGIVPAKRSERADDVARLVAGTGLAEAAAAAAARAQRSSGVVAADAFVSAARLAGAAGRREELLRLLEAAIEADPSHDVAASLFVRTAMQSPDSDSIQRFLRTRLAALEANDWYIALRVTAFALIDSPHHRGLGLRLLRHLLERAYEDPPAEIPAHLAIWSVLAAQAKADRSRRDLLPLAIQGLEVSRSPVDRVWLGALAAEISLRDANDPVVAGRYAEIVSEYAPEHPIVRELVAAVASPPSAKRSTTIPPVPAEAIHAAKAVEAAGWADISLDDIILGVATEAVMPLVAAGPGVRTAELHRARATSDDVDEPEISPPPQVAASTVRRAEPPIVAAASRPAAASPRVQPPIERASRTAAAPLYEQPPITPSFIRETVVSPVDDPPLVKTPAASPSPGRSAHAEPPITASVAAPVPARAPEPQPPIKRVAPVRVEPPSKAPVRANVSTAATASLPRSPPGGALPAVRRAPAAAGLPPLPPLARGVLDALRTPDRPALPARAPDPPDAKERARRIAVSIDVRFHTSGGTEGKGVSRDVSTSGLFVTTSAPLAVGDELALVLMMPGKEAFFEEEFHARARVVRSEERGHGIQLLDPPSELLAALAAL